EITVNGDTYNSFEEYITHVTESTGGFTKIVYDQTTGDAIFQEWDEITNTWVNVDNSKFETIVQANESQTLLVQTTEEDLDRKSTRLNSSHVKISYAVFCLKKKNIQ